MAKPRPEHASVDDVAEEFARRWRNGERPSVEEYMKRYPRWTTEIQDLLPAVQMMEELKPRREDAESRAHTLPEPTVVPEKIGHFRIIREIGRGGMGVVYEAVQESLGRRVALKVLPKHLLSNEKLRTRFHRESQAAARLHHTNIVPVFGVGEADGLCFYYMQLISGQGLDQVIRTAAAGLKPRLTARQVHTVGRVLPAKTSPTIDSRPSSGTPVAEDGPLPNGSKTVMASRSPAEYIQTVARMGVQVADALAYAHSQGVLHRDIKPSNLILDDRGTVWVTDFGVAKLLEEAQHTQSGDVVGTLKYMSPERFAGKSDARGDVYSLGITLYELLTLRPAFPDTTPQHLIQLITLSDPPPLRKSNPNVPRDLETIVLKAASRHADQRYQTAGELADDLRRFLDDRTISARRAGPIEQAWRWCRRNTALAASLAIAFLLMVAVTVISVVAYVRTAAANQETANANQGLNKSLLAEQAQREHAENTSSLALEALNRMYDRFAPTRLVVTPPSSTEEGVEVPLQPSLPPEAVPLMEELLQTYEQIARASGEFPRLQAQAAEANHRIGDIGQRLSRYEEAAMAYQNAIELYLKLPASADTNAGRIKLARCYNELAKVLRSQQKFEEAGEIHGRAIKTLTDAPSAFTQRPESRYELARTYYALIQRPMFPGPGGPGRGPGRGGRGPGLGGPPQGGPPPGPEFGRGRPFQEPPRSQPGEFREQAPVQQAVSILEQLIKEHPKVPEYRHLLACCYRDTSRLTFTRETQETRSNYERAVELLRQLVSDFAKVPDYLFDLCETLAWVPLDRFESREETAKFKVRLEEALTRSSGLVTQYPDVPQYRVAYAQYNDRMGFLLSAEHDLEGAEKAHRKAVSSQAGLVKQFPEVVEYAFWLSLMERALARVLTDMGQLKESRSLLEGSAERMEHLRKQDSRPMPPLGMIYSELADVLARLGETERAAELRQKASQMRPGRQGPPRGGNPR